MLSLDHTLIWDLVVTNLFMRSLSGRFYFTLPQLFILKVFLHEIMKLPAKWLITLVTSYNNILSAWVLYYYRTSVLQNFAYFHHSYNGTHAHTFSYTWISKSSIDTWRYQYCKYQFQYQYHISTSIALVQSQNTHSHVYMYINIINHRHINTYAYTVTYTHIYTVTLTHTQLHKHICIHILCQPLQLWFLWK